MSTRNVSRNRQDSDKELVAIDDIMLTLEAIKQISAKLYSGNGTTPHLSGLGVASGDVKRRRPSPIDSTGDDDNCDVTTTNTNRNSIDGEQIGRLLPLDYPDRHEISRHIQALSTQKRKK